MRGACAGEHCKFDSIGVGVTGVPRPWPCHATDERGVRGGALQVRLVRRGCHFHFWKLEQSSVEKAGIQPTYQARYRRAASVALSLHGRRRMDLRWKCHEAFARRLPSHSKHPKFAGFCGTSRYFAVLRGTSRDFAGLRGTSGNSISTGNINRKERNIKKCTTQLAWRAERLRPAERACS
jgi:hypothetical protein